MYTPHMYVSSDLRPNVADCAGAVCIRLQVHIMCIRNHGDGWPLAEIVNGDLAQVLCLTSSWQTGLPTAKKSRHAHHAFPLHRDEDILYIYKNWNS